MKNIVGAVDKYRDLILQTERYIWQNPELGYKEVKTSKYLADIFTSLGYKLNYAENITGFYTTLDTGKEGPTVLILGELDSIICPTHPESDKETGAVHSCGHNAQCAALVGIAAALKEEKVFSKLCGKIMLCAVPAEELLEIEYRNQLKNKGIIKYFGGKPEFLHRGYFDGVDIAFMVHTSTWNGCRAGSVGCLSKQIIYKGKAAHAGGSPWNGRNALYAATCGLNAVNATRETFQDSNLIRVHPIITKAGDMVNAIPERAYLESYVRGKTFDAIQKANKKVNTALTGAALSLENNIEIIDIPGYAPLENDKNLKELAKETFCEIFPDEPFNVSDIYSTGSTDMGDISCVMPAIHPYCAGATGTSHGADYKIADPEKACVNSAKFQLALLTKLLSNGALEAKKIIAEFVPRFNSKEEYFEYVDSFSISGDRISYDENGNAIVKI